MIQEINVYLHVYTSIIYSEFHVLEKMQSLQSNLMILIFF